MSPTTLDCHASVFPPPARTTRRGPVPAPARPAARPGPARATILLVDDDPAVRESLRRVLEAQHWQVRTAATGEAGLEALQAEEPDLLITDLCLAAVNGWDLLFHESLQRPHLPIFVITALPLHEAGGAEKFATNFFVKPLDLEALLAAIRHQLERPRPAPPA